MPAPSTYDPTSERDARLRAAQDPAPSAIERGPIARMNWRHGLDVDPDLVRVTVDAQGAPAELPSLLAETHASLLDPEGTTPLARPSAIGASTLDALRAHDAWQRLSDASRAHPLIAREAVVQLADVVTSALRRAGAQRTTDSRVSAAELERARAALERARAAQQAAKASGDAAKLREATQAAIEAAKAEERAKAAVAVDRGVAERAGDLLDAASEELEEIADKAERRAEAAFAWAAALGDATGVGGNLAIPDAVLEALTPETVAMLKLVGALRASLKEGRASRHVRGHEGMLGVSTGGLEHARDLTPLALASFAGHLGAPSAALTSLALVEGNAPVVEKGGGIARDGDVVVVVDKSGSMTMAGRETWAGALALAILLEARADDRTAGVITYDGRVRHSILVDSTETLARAVTALMEGSGGDNNEHAALVEASALLARMPHGGDPADVLMLTDGQWQASNLAGVNLDRARLRGCFIGGSAPVGAGFTETWEVRACEGAEANALAVTIARSIV